MVGSRHLVHLRTSFFFSFLKQGPEVVRKRKVVEDNLTLIQAFLDYSNKLPFSAHVQILVWTRSSIECLDSDLIFEGKECQWGEFLQLFIANRITIIVRRYIEHIEIVIKLSIYHIKKLYLNVLNIKCMKQLSIIYLYIMLIMYGQYSYRYYLIKLYSNCIKIVF